MSYTEMHTGSLKKVSKTFTKEELIKFLDDNQEFYVDDLEEKIGYNYHYYEVFHKETDNLVFILHENNFYQVLNHYESDSADYLQDVRMDENGIINFNLIFYNGVTCFSEMLAGGLDEL